MSELKEISKKQEQSTSGPSLSEITSSLYSSLSVSGHATVVSTELTPNKQKAGTAVGSSTDVDGKETGTVITVPTPFEGEELHTQMGFFCSDNFGRSI